MHLITGENNNPIFINQTATNASTCSAANTNMLLPSSRRHHFSRSNLINWGTQVVPLWSMLLDVGMFKTICFYLFLFLANLCFLVLLLESFLLMILGNLYQQIYDITYTKGIIYYICVHLHICLRDIACTHTYPHKDSTKICPHKHVYVDTHTWVTPISRNFAETCRECGKKFGNCQSGKCRLIKQHIHLGTPRLNFDWPEHSKENAWSTEISNDGHIQEQTLLSLLLAKFQSFWIL